MRKIILQGTTLFAVFGGAMSLCSVVLAVPTHFMPHDLSTILWVILTRQFLTENETPTLLIFGASSWHSVTLIAVTTILYAVAGLFAGCVVALVARRRPVRRLIVVLVLLTASLGFSFGFARHRPFSPTPFAESSEWKTWDDDRITIRLPEDWNILRINELCNGAVYIGPFESLRGYGVFEGTNHLFSVLTAEHGSRFVLCLCAPFSEYRYARRDNHEVWVFDWHWRCMKKSCGSHRMDIHLPYQEGYATNLLNYVAESCRFREGIERQPKR